MTTLKDRPVREDLVTQLCLEVQGAVIHERRLADRSLEFALRHARHLYSTERRAVAERTYALLRRLRLVDFLLARTLSTWSALTSTRQDLLRLALSRVLDGEAPAAVAGSLRLPRGEAAALEKAPGRRADLDQLERTERLGVAGSLPDFLAAAFIAELGAEAEPAVDAMNVRAPLSLRANALKVTREELARRLEREGVAARPAPLAPDGLIAEPGVNLFGIASFREGLFEFQDQGSQLLGLLADAPPRLVVDACAGAGGKTLQLAAQMRNRGELYALDVDARRLDELRRRARRAGAHNVRVTPIDTPEATAAAMQRLHGAAERVLVDAPCSGTGTFRRKPDARYRLDAATLAAHAARQRDLLDRYAPLVKPRGRLVYGTCSLLRDENEAVIDDFLRRHPDFALAPPERWLPPDAPIPLTRGGMLRLYPHRHDTDGFFGAVLVREAAPPGKAALP